MHARATMPGEALLQPALYAKGKKKSVAVVARLEPGWVRDAAEGYVLMRDGKDYVNNGGRYDRALEKLRAAGAAAEAAGADRLDVARILLWTGISIQENVDHDAADGGPQKRNREAMEHYLRGVERIRYVRAREAIGVRMSLYNSLGVACQGGKTICSQARTAKFYQRAADIYAAAPEDLQRELEHLMDKVRSNANGLLRGGGAVANNVGGGNCAI